MRIAMIVTSFEQLASNDVFANIVTYLHDKDFEFDIYYFNRVREQIKVPCRTLKLGYFERLDFCAYDVIHTHGPRAAAYMAMHKHRFNGKHVMTMHSIIQAELASTYSDLFSKIVSPLWLWMARKSEMVVSISETMMLTYASMIKGPCHTFIYNGIPEIIPSCPADEADINILCEIRKHYKVLGSVSRVTPIKGLEQTIKLLAVRSDFYFVLVGDGLFLPKLKELAKEYGVYDRCLFLGHRDAGYRYLSYFDIFLMTSYSEGFGLSLAEAARAKRSCVCSDIQVFREIYSENEVTYFDLGNIASLERAVDKAYTNKEQLGANIHNKFVKCFTSRTMAEAYGSIYCS